MNIKKCAQLSNVTKYASIKLLYLFKVIDQDLEILARYVFSNLA